MECIVTQATTVRVREEAASIPCPGSPGGSHGRAPMWQPGGCSSDPHLAALHGNTIKISRTLEHSLTPRIIFSFWKAIITYQLKITNECKRQKYPSAVLHSLVQIQEKKIMVLFYMCWSDIWNPPSRSGEVIIELSQSFAQCVSRLHKILFPLVRSLLSLIPNPGINSAN